MTAIWMAFIAGLSGFAHCLGMCGPFALHWAGGKRALARQLFWHAGRITAYTFLGCLAGFAGSRILLLPYAGAIGRVMAYAAALVMLLSALRLLGWLSIREGSGGLARLLAPILQGMLHEESLAAPAMTGMLCGFLPCPMTLAFLAVAVTTENAAQGGAILAALGTGTLIPLLLLGLSGKVVLNKLGRLTRPAGAIVLTAVAATMILRPTAFGQCPVCQHARMQQALTAEGLPDEASAKSCGCATKPTGANPVGWAEPQCCSQASPTNPASQPQERNPSTCPSRAANTADCH